MTGVHGEEELATRMPDSPTLPRQRASRRRRVAERRLSGRPPVPQSQPAELPGSWDPRVPTAAFRAALLGICAVLASLPAAEHRALVPLAALGLAGWAVLRVRRLRPFQTQVAYVEAAAVGVSIAWSGGPQSALLPYLLAPGLGLGLLRGPWAVVRAGALAASTIALLTAFTTPPADRTTYLVTVGQWVLLATAIGMVATWARRVAESDDEPFRGYAEAHALLEQLRTVARGLPVSLDAGAAAETLLAELALVAPSTRSGVLVRTVTGGALIPLAVRGVRRVPWRTPLTEPGPLKQAWETGRPVVDRRRPDIAGRRHGSTLAVIPLGGSSETFGLVVLETTRPDAFGDQELSGASVATRRMALRLETSLLFDEVRSVASAEERNRLAREMHDGVAQDLAFVGYRLDELRTKSIGVDPGLSQDLRELRQEVTALISNLRLSITDLRTSLTADRGLGAALTSYIRAVASGRSFTVHVSLRESAFRLPADREVALFRVAQLVAQDVREAGKASNLWATLHVDPPSARLVVEHDGEVGEEGHDLATVALLMHSLGGALHMRPRRGGGARVEAVFGGGDDADSGPSRR